MRELSVCEIGQVSGGQLPDEDLQDMRNNNPGADNWKDVTGSPPSQQMCTPDQCWDTEPGHIPLDPLPFPG
mgnify:CR=1 FL=1